MLQAIRDRAQGWIAWAIVILIAIPFAFWGIESYLGGGSEPVVAKVNGQEITERDLDYQFQSFRRQLRERLGSAFRPELFDDTKLRGEVLDNMVRDLVVMQVSASMGLAASDQEIRAAILSEPAFQRSGQFDKAAYERALQLQGVVPRQFEEQLRQRLISTQLTRVVSATEIATEREIAEAVRLLTQQRAVSYVIVPAARFLSNEPISDQAVSAYYETYQDSFRTPEQVRLAYIVLGGEGMVASAEPNDEELRALYDNEIDRFRQPEQRSVRHILIQVPSGADEAALQAARERAEQVRVRLEAGEDFATLAKELSDDPGSAPQGGDLGVIEPGMMDPAFEQGAYGLAKGEISQPVRSAFGYHLIRVDEVVPEAIKPFEEVKDQLVAEVQKKHAERQYFDVAERLANLTYEHPDSLEPAAQALGLEIQTSDWISRQGGAGVLAHPKVTAAAFAPDVLGQGNNSELIEPEKDVLQAVVVRVLEHREASVKPLEEVRGNIETAIRTERSREVAKEKAMALVSRLKQGTQLKEAIGDYPLTELGLIGRDAAVTVPQEVRNLAFTLPKPKPGEASFGDATLANGDAVVVAVNEVKDGSVDALTPQQREQEQQRLVRTLGRQYYDHLLGDLVSRAKVERHSLGRTRDNP